MAETSNFALMADKISDEIFTKLKWNRIGSKDRNWACLKETHERKTHPSDLVMYYDEPYRNLRTYVNFDLKSYARDTIKLDKINSALSNLAKTMSCAEISSEWQSTYTDSQKNFSTVGVLFIYNHDGEYDRNFDTMLSKVNHNELEIPPESRLFVLGPSRIRQLDNITTDITLLQGRKVLPINDNDYWFYYPNLSGLVNLRPESKPAATLEMLTSAWTILEYVDSNDPSNCGSIVYYSAPGNTKEEFLYLIDYIQHYQMLSRGKKVLIRLHDHTDNTFSLFQHAVNHYVQDRGGDRELSDRLNSIKIGKIEKQKTIYCEELLGMER